MKTNQYLTMPPVNGQSQLAAEATDHENSMKTHILIAASRLPNMMKIMMSWFVLRVVAGVLLLMLMWPPSTNAFCETGLPHGLRHCHDFITEEAFNFMRWNIVREIVDGNLDQDSGDSEDMAERHFTDCRFGASAMYINGVYARVIGALDPRAPVPFAAAHDFGQLLHPVQDFYSHSNWIDPVPIGLRQPELEYCLLDDGLGEWRVLGLEPFEILRWERKHVVPIPGLGLRVVEGIALVQGPLPPDVSLDLPTDPTRANYKFCPDDPANRLEVEYPLSGLPIVTKLIGGQKVSFKGLLTATTCAGLTRHESECPAGAQIAHEKSGSFSTDQETYEHCFNHDNLDRPRHREAGTNAILQTNHEWFRLLHLAKNSRFGYAASSILMSLWAKPVAASVGPHGSIEVTVRPTVRLQRDAAGEKLVFVLYTGDFRRAIYRVSDSGDTSLEPLTMWVNNGDTLVATVWGWEDWTSLGLGNGEFDSGDPVLRGVTRVLAGPTFERGSYEDASADMTVNFEVRVGESQTLFVDRDYTGTEAGTFERPFNTVGEAHMGAAPQHSRIVIQSASYPELLTLLKPITLQAEGGPVTIGR